MGTLFTIDLYAVDEDAADHAMSVAFDEVDRLDALLSNYRPSSELSRISREAGRGAVTTDPETFRFLERSLYWSQQSEGAFDITVGPLLRAWGFFQHGGRIPSDAELAALRKTTGWEKVRLDAALRTVMFTTRAPMELDPGSIGKGFAVDSVVHLLRDAGVRSALISAGESTVYGIGSPPGEAGWPVEVPDPRSAGVTATTVFLRDTSLSSGACTQKFFIRDGHRYCHIFNPKTRRPVEGIVQTTVISPSATDSDALSTVVFVMPIEESRRLIETLDGTGALLFPGDVSNPGGSAGGCVALHWNGQPCAPGAAVR
jgi:thiamine biosynthesis lipoprotein